MMYISISPLLSYRNTSGGWRWHQTPSGISWYYPHKYVNSSLMIPRWNVLYSYSQELLNLFITSHMASLPKKTQARNLARLKKWSFYSCGSRAISISWSDFPLVSTTFLFTKTTAIMQKVVNIEYRSCAPSFSSNGRNSKPTKKFITWRIPS